ncbi:MAG: antitoxin [Mycobacterium sp.]|nr:antitoxin [Mycobacterium sp.]
MATPTTTIRVSVRTRDRLAAQARQRGISIPTLLAELAGQADRDAAFREERSAELMDAASAEVRQEEQEWAQAADDGLA